jgi:hypothetical protein
LGDSSTNSSWSDGQGPSLQTYPFCENSTPEKKKKKAWLGPKPDFFTYVVKPEPNLFSKFFKPQKAQA